MRSYIIQKSSAHFNVIFPENAKTFVSAPGSRRVPVCPAPSARPGQGRAYHVGGSYGAQGAGALGEG